MAQKVQVLLACDLCEGGKLADQTVAFSLDGARYEIDLCGRHAKQMRDDIAPFVTASPRVEEDPLVALTLLDGVIRLIEVSTDGRYRFLDEQDLFYKILYSNVGTAESFHSAVAEFEELINDPHVTEAALQDFFERWPEFLTGDDYKSAHSHVVLSGNEGSLIPDFMLEPLDDRRMCDLLELKLPQVPVVIGARSGRPGLSHAVRGAIRQLRQYYDHFEQIDARSRVYEAYGISAFRPQMYIVIGRRGDVDSLTFRRATSADSPLAIVRTYDDLLDRMRHRLA